MGRRGEGKGLFGEGLSLTMALLFGRVRVEGASMVPLLASGQRLLAGRLPHVFRVPTHGDIVVVRHPGRHGVLLVKRIVAVPGESVSVRGGRLIVDDGPAAVRGDGSGDREWTLRTREYFVAGARGEVSSSIGPIPKEAIVGKVWLCYWPLERWGNPASLRGPASIVGPATANRNSAETEVGL